jgi:hypothetical protein
MRSTEAEERCRDLSGRIGAILKDGLSVSKETLHFIDSTCAVSDPDSLKEILNDESKEEVETLWSLIFFPDAAFQGQLEGFLQSHRFHASDEDLVAKYLAEGAPEIPLRFPDPGKTFSLVMPDWTAAQFVSRLNISKPLNERLRSLIDRRFPGNPGLLIKVKLRNSTFSETEERIRFLCAFFEREIEDPEGCLELVLDLFEEMPDEKSIYERLIERKRRCFQSLQKADLYRKMLERDNVETLMLRGVRILSIDEPQARSQMNSIDRICLAVFGKTEYFQRAEEVLESGGFRYE